MAPFNPQINPTNDPNYLGYSHPISQPDADKTAGVALKGLGDTIEVTAKAGDSIIKNKIDDEVYDAVSAERQAYTSATELLHSGKVGLPTSLTADTSTIPDELEDVENTAGGIREGFRAKKYGYTHYAMRLHQYAQEMRSKYPGHREYIDKKIAAITGFDPANTYLNQMLSEISAAQTARGSSANKMENLFMRSDVSKLENVNVIRDQWLKDGNDNAARSWILERLGQEGEFERKGRIRDSEVKDKAVDKDKAISDMTLRAGEVVGNYISDIKRVIGPDRWNRVVSGEEKLDTVTAKNLALSLKTKVVEARDKLYADFNRIYGKTSFSSRAGTDETKKVINDQVAAIENIANLIDTGQVSLASQNADYVEALKTDFARNMMRNEDVASMALQLDLLRRYGGNDLPRAALEAVVANPNMLKTITDETKSFIKYHTTKASTQINPNKPHTFKDTADEAARLKKDGVQPATTNEAFINQVGMIADPKVSDPIKERLATFYFHPANSGILNRFRMDEVDERGMVIPGRTAIYNKFADKKVAAALYKLGGESWENYKNFMEKEFGQGIYKVDIQNLSAFQASPGVYISWDTDNKRFGMHGPDSRIDLLTTNQGQGATIQPGLRRVLTRLNRGLVGLKNIAEVSGENVDQYLLDFMMEMGYNPTKGSSDSIPDDILKAIAHPYAKELLKKKMAK